MVNVSFTEQELNVLVQLLDLAVKQGGLNVAGAAFLIQQKIASSVQAAAPVADKVD